MVLAALVRDTQHLESRARKQNWCSWCQYNVTGWNIMSCIWGTVFQCSSTLKVSIELPATARLCHDMTERLLKVM